MDDHFSQRMARALIIALPCFILNACLCSALLSSTQSDALFCISILLVGIISLLVGWLFAGLIRQQRFVQVPRYNDDDFYGDEKPKRG